MTIELQEAHDSKFERIVSGARHEIAERGIVGLRVQEVARSADCSVSLIYRHFTSRDGLIAHVLTEDYERNMRRWLAIADEIESGSGPVDMEKLIGSMALPTPEHMKRMRWARVQALAASTDNVVLQERLRDLARSFQDVTERIVRHVAERNSVPITFNVTAFSQMTMNFALMLIHNEFLEPENQIDDDDMRNFLRDLLSRYLF